MNSEEILAEISFLGNRVSSFGLETRMIDTKGQRPEISFDFDFNVKSIHEHNNRLIGIIEFIVKAKATANKKVLFKINLVMEGAFAGNLNSKFQEMLEINGVVTLSQISRAYLLSVTSQSGIPPVKMPMINVLKLREKKKGADAPDV